MSGQKILVIKLGALGDFVQALGPMRAIRNHHKDDRITLLTTKPFLSLGTSCGYFDDVLCDIRPKWFQPLKWITLSKQLNKGRFARVYDLQNNDRTSLYFKLFSLKPEWVGVAKGASHRNTSPTRTAGKAFDGHVQTLGLAGIQNVTPDTLEWMKPSQDFSHLPKPYALMVPGGSPKHPKKRWPADYFARLSQMISDKGLTPIIIGTKDEEAEAQTILNANHRAISLVAKTSLMDIPALARGAAFAIGNDTGPMHFIAATGCKTCVLFGGTTTPKRHAPMGEHVKTLQAQDLKDLNIETVLKEIF